MIDAETRCEYCGYDLRGHEGTWRQCPECGEWNDLTTRKPRRFLSKKWNYLAIGTAAAIFIPLFGFRIWLRANGFRLMDLWGGLDARLAATRAQSSGLASVPPDVPKFAAIGLTLSKVCFCLAGVVCIYSICVIIAAIGQRDRQALLTAGLCAIACIIAGIMSMQIGFVIVGM